MSIDARRRTSSEMQDWRTNLMLITEELKPATVRQVFYQCTVRGLIDKTEQGYKKVAATLANLRKDGVMPFDWLADNTRFMRKPRSFDSLADAITDCARYYRRDALTRSDRYIEVWLEKDALSGVIIDSTREYDVPLMVARGFASLSFLHSAAETIKHESRPTTIYHLGDYDPSGQQAAKSTHKSLLEMSGRDDLEFVQLAVLPEQIEEWRLPSRPTKRDGNTHAKGWIGDSVELDAIHPDMLRKLVTDTLCEHLPDGELHALRVAEESERDALKIFGHEVSKIEGDDVDAIEWLTEELKDREYYEYDAGKARMDELLAEGEVL